MVGDPSAQLRVFSFELGQTIAERVNRLGDFLLCEARRDVLRAIPVKRFQAQPKDAFELRPVVRHRDKFGQRRVGIERQDFYVGVDLEPRAVCVVTGVLAPTRVMLSRAINT